MENKIKDVKLSNDELLDKVAEGELFSTPVDVLEPGDTGAVEITDDALENVSGGDWLHVLS